jgi:hypothetical protein
MNKLIKMVLGVLLLVGCGDVTVSDPVMTKADGDKVTMPDGGAAGAPGSDAGNAGAPGGSTGVGNTTGTGGSAQPDAGCQQQVFICNGQPNCGPC